MFIRSQSQHFNCLDCRFSMKRARYLDRESTYRHQCGATLVTDPALLRALEESGAASSS